MTLVVAFVLGLLFGLAGAPAVFSYLRWKAAQAYASIPWTDGEPSAALRGPSR